jgi:DNA-directed RNA polymerase specialized sigma subunit
METDLTIKELLQRIRNNNLRIKALQERRYEYYTMALRSKDFDKVMTSRTNDFHSQTEDVVLRLQDLEQDMCDSIIRYTEDVKLAEQLINSLTDIRQRDILTFRYMNCWSWQKIARLMNYERTQIWRIHGAALMLLDDKLKKLQRHATSNCVIMDM